MGKYNISAKTTSVVSGNSILPEGKFERNEAIVIVNLRNVIQIDSSFQDSLMERLKGDRAVVVLVSSCYVLKSRVI